jgi:hypothetical protein
MHRFLRVIWTLVLFELGVLLLFLPWMRQWETNYFLTQFPALRPFLLHPSIRGTISGLGALDIFLAVGMLRRRPAASEAHGA